MAANIILVGFMGTGKSAVGRAVAKRLNRRFVDMDHLIEERAGKKISAIFADDGEARFRERERDLVRELSGCQDLVIATGGGVVLNPDNLRDFGRTGVVICLQADPDTILERVGHHSHRPLLEQAEDKGRVIRDLLATRRPLYDAIALRINTTRLTTRQVAEEVCRMNNAECRMPNAAWPERAEGRSRE